MLCNRTPRAEVRPTKMLLAAGAAAVLTVVAGAAPSAHAQPSGQARDICNALMSEARTERQRSQAGPARQRARIVLTRCLDLLPGLRDEAQGIVNWADQQQAEADAAQRKPAEPAEAEFDIPLLSRGGGEGTSLLRDRTAPAAAGAGAAGGTGSAGGQASSQGLDSCMARAEEAVRLGTPHIRSAGSMNGTQHTTATMLRAVIAALQPCAGDPGGAERIRQYQTAFEAALKGCRQTASQPATCDRPAY